MYDGIYEAEISLCNINKLPLQLKINRDEFAMTELLKNLKNKFSSSKENHSIEAQNFWTSILLYQLTLFLRHQVVTPPNSTWTRFDFTCFSLSISSSTVNLGHLTFSYCFLTYIVIDWFSSLRLTLLFESSTLDRNKTSSYNSSIEGISSGLFGSCPIVRLFSTTSKLIVGHIGRIGQSCDEHS